MNGQIILVKADAGMYKNNIELTLTYLDFQHGVTDVLLFLPSVNVEKVWNDFGAFVNTHLTPKALAVLNAVFTGENIYESFKTTWAAKTNHDARIGGLMNHTLKILRICRTLIENDERLAEWSDLLYLGIILHDIGKIHELDDSGEYTENAFVSHRAIGVEMLTRHKQAIVENFGESFFYHIMAIQLGHHGEFADPPTTVWAKLIHLMDTLECHSTMYLDIIENKSYTERNRNRVVYDHGTYLTI